MTRSVDKSVMKSIVLIPRCRNIRSALGRPDVATPYVRLLKGISRENGQFTHACCHLVTLLLRHRNHARICKDAVFVPVLSPLSHVLFNARHYADMLVLYVEVECA